MSAPPFSEAYLEHVRRPPHAGAWPADTPGVATGEAFEPGDGRCVRIQLRATSSRIEDARFQAFGCSATLACASWLTATVIGLDPSAAARIAPRAVVHALEVPPERAPAADLAVRALRAALAALRPLARR